MRRAYFRFTSFRIYCIVLYTRGSERSRDIDPERNSDMRDKAFCEDLLQNVNSYLL